MGIYIAIWVICGLVASAIAASKGRSAMAWGALGFLLGPLAVLAAMFQSKSEANITTAALERGSLVLCPFCKEPVKADAIKCKHCHSALPDEDESESVDRAAHLRFQEAIAANDMDTLNSMLSSGFDTAECPLPFGHKDYAELHGSDEVVELIASTPQR